ncbi:MAG: ATP-binding protein [Gammaproteobacteria bacterium]
MINSGKHILFIGILLFCFMLLSLLLLSDSLQNSELFGEYYLGLLIFNAVGLLILIVLIGINFRSLLAQLKNRIAGARMTVRMVSMFALLSVTPVLIVYYFSLDFLHRGIDSWFDLRVEQALEDSLELSRLALGTRMKELLRQTETTAEEMAEISDPAMAFEIDEYRIRNGAEEFTLMGKQGSIIASSTGDTANLVPESPDETVLFQVQQGSSYIGVDMIRNTSLSIRVVVNVPKTDFNRQERIIQAIYPVTERVNELTSNVQNAFIEYKELSYLREQLKVSFILILTIVLLFSIFSAVWAAFYFARTLAEPIRDLAEGTKSVAEGDYHKRLPIPGNDELGFLVASFNTMTSAISSARDVARKSQQQAEAEHKYLDAILSRLSSGVWVLDADQTIRTANIRSGEILGLDINEIISHSLKQITARYAYLEPLLQSFSRHIGQTVPDWREENTIFGNSGKQILMSTGTSLTMSSEQQPVYVIVFDDVTALVHNERDAAWTEMARRLAHEIKNPLTPIKLSADRLRHKYLHSLPQDQVETLDRLTKTIINQVDTMQEMVDSFSEYARVPVIRPQPLELNHLLREILDLYRNLDHGVQIELALEPGLPAIHADPGRLRQVFNNLINNAFDASSRQAVKQLAISTGYAQAGGTTYIETRIRDSGSGLDDSIRDTLFDPYVTTKSDGTGLGLPIVKKIVEEHGGLVWLENNTDGKGACAIIRLPVLENTSVVQAV